MKLLRLKITDPKGFRSLQAGFEYSFRSEWTLQEEQGFAPFICAGPNGSGKSNLLEALAAIFYHLECIYLENLPDSFRFEEEENRNGFRAERAQPDAYELEYVLSIQDRSELGAMGMGGNARIKVTKQAGEGPKWFLVSGSGDEPLKITQTLGRQLLPDYILGYSSGENEILSLPFFKLRFVQFDEYGQALKQQLPYPGRPESRLVYLDSGFSQAILLCNLLFQDAEALTPFRNDVKIEELREFRIIIRRSIEVSSEVAEQFGEGNPALTKDTESGRYRVHLIRLLEADEKVQEELRNQQEKSVTRYESFDPAVTRLKRCATCWYLDEVSDTLYLDYRVNEATRQAFRENFDFEVNHSPIALFQAFQVLLTLNLFSVSDPLKADLYQSDSHYVSETVPTLASDERIMRFKFVKFRKTDVDEPVMLKNLSDGEHQLLHTLGLCLLFKNTQSLFLLDEPETHFNPDWRANFVTRLHQSLAGSDSQEMLVTTHTPFLISDSRPEKVLVFNKDKETGEVTVKNPEYNTLGASINKITMATFDKRETIGGYAQAMLDDLRLRFEQGEDKEQLIAEIDRQLGDSVEKILLIKTILGAGSNNSGEGQS
jgi:restriction system-associated AAA family ATPase